MSLFVSLSLSFNFGLLNSAVKLKSFLMYLQDYQRVLDLIRDIILATDLAHHLRIFKDLQKMADGTFQ